MFDRSAWQKADRKKNLARYREYDRKAGLKRRAKPGFSDVQADRVLRCRYGITLEQKLQMYKDQEGLCGLCGKPLPEDYRKAHVDHDHKSDTVRGLLHFNCNKFVGFLEKNEGLIGPAYIYLGKVKGNN